MGVVCDRCIQRFDQDTEGLNARFFALLHQVPPHQRAAALAGLTRIAVEHAESDENDDTIPPA